MKITRSCCIDCQGAFHALRPEDLRRTLRFFCCSECKLIENFFGIRKIFVSWRAKHEATYIVNTKTYDTNVDLVMAMQRASIVESHILLDCSQQVTANCSTLVQSILMFLAKYYKQTILAPPYLLLRPYSGGQPPATTPLLASKVTKLS